MITQITKKMNGGSHTIKSNIPHMKKPSLFASKTKKKEYKEMQTQLGSLMKLTKRKSELLKAYKKLNNVKEKQSFFPNLLRKVFSRYENSQSSRLSNYKKRLYTAQSRVKKEQSRIIADMANHLVEYPDFKSSMEANNPNYNKSRAESNNNPKSIPITDFHELSVIEHKNIDPEVRNYMSQLIDSLEQKRQERLNNKSSKNTIPEVLPRNYEKTNQPNVTQNLSNLYKIPSSLANNLVKANPSTPKKITYEIPSRTKLKIDPYALVDPDDDEYLPLLQSHEPLLFIPSTQKTPLTRSKVKEKITKMPLENFPTNNRVLKLKQSPNFQSHITSI